jgi:hypothetical protein
MADPYTDPESGVLVNRLGLATQPELERVERDLTSFALLSWTARGVPRPLAIACLSRIARRRPGPRVAWKEKILERPWIPCTHGDAAQRAEWVRWHGKSHSPVSRRRVLAGSRGERAGEPPRRRTTQVVPGLRRGNQAAEDPSRRLAWRARDSG